jgi:hypothetical protein
MRRKTPKPKKKLFFGEEVYLEKFEPSRRFIQKVRFPG